MSIFKFRKTRNSLLWSYVKCGPMKKNHIFNLEYFQIKNIVLSLHHQTSETQKT